MYETHNMTTELKQFPQSKDSTVNPKDLVGNTKVSITKFPVIGTIYGAMAMMDGAEKYGPYNWRDKEVVASIYIDAAQRHLMSWFEGQEKASDSKVHHLGHTIACCAILLDAQLHGKLVDDRPVPTGSDLDKLEKVLAELSEVIKQRKAGKAVAQSQFLTGLSQGNALENRFPTATGISEGNLSNGAGEK